MRRLVYLLLFLAYVDEGQTLYADHMFAPFHWVEEYFFKGIANVRLFDVAMFMILLYATFTGGRAGPMVKPLKRWLFGAVGVTLFALVWGLARGGDARAAGWQVYLPITTVLATFTIASVCRTTEHFLGLGRTIVYAGIYRALMCLFFWAFYVHGGGINPRPDYFTSHHDTVIWTIGIPFVVVSAMMLPSTKARALAAFVVPLFMAAIQLNNRRLAWISLGGGVTATYFLLPPSKAKRKAQRIALAIVPVIALYAAVGWGRTEGVFRPLRAFQTVSTEQDNSTKARNCENLGLIATAQQHGWVFGSGWGQRYVEITDKYNIHFMELWPYVPHNSVLGLLAYTGYMGFIGYWMLFPIAAFLHARLARAGPRAQDRLVGLLGMMQIVSCADQWYGDMGSFSKVTMYTLAGCLAAALRIPALTGTWPGAVAPKTAATPARARMPAPAGAG